jgi:site-specific DNA-methyltransferase (adenine-specific)
MVNKPMSESTIVDNVLKWGTGAMNVDGCRIPFKNKDDMWKGKFGAYGSVGQTIYGNGKGYVNRTLKDNIKGRFSANLLVSDRAIDSGKISKTGNLSSKYKGGKDKKGNIPSNVYGKYKRGLYPNRKGDIGDQSRYFDLDNWWNHRCIFFDVPKPSKRERDKGLENSKSKVKDTEGKFSKSKNAKDKNLVDRLHRQKLRKNFHPTVKPIKLMAYLIELGCSKEGIVLDPFVGSGTTCIAAQRLNRKWIGIELNEEYAKIAAARLGNVEIIRDFKLIEVKQEIKQVVKNISKSNRPRCGYEGNCDYKDSEGNCMMKGKCNSKVI